MPERRRTVAGVLRSRRIGMAALVCAAALGGAAPWVFAAGENGITTEKWESLGQAPPVFWIVTGAIALGLLGFMAWTYFSGRVPRSINPGTLAAFGGLLIVWTFFLYLVPALTAMQVDVTDRTWDWRPGETLTDPGGSGLTGEPYRGYRLYIANNCAACHTLYVRPQDLGTGWAEGAQPDDVARATDYVRMPEPPLGTQRNGPDLSHIGRRIPDMQYQIDHLKEPRRFKPDSVMPTYRHLSERDLRDLAAFLVTLGNSKEELQAGGVAVAQVAELSAIEQRGQALYRSRGCVACHTLDGNPSVGPTWKGMWGREETLTDGRTVTVDEAYVREAILDPRSDVVEGYPNVMPAFQLADDEIEALIAFMKTLK
ncbi:MAG TPA: c-type cytochrome [Limnochordia bacterium]